jgi:peptidoglycan/xylan/chitin deacetylase (PgdA/CDA1 family)
MQVDLGIDYPIVVGGEKRQKRIPAYAVWLFVLLAIIPLAGLGVSCKNTEKPPLVIRVDDVQDYAFREAQLFLLNESVINEIPLSLAVIAGAFGDDGNIVPAVKLALNSGSEVTVHGWEHEDITQLPLSGQKELLSRARSQIKNILGYEATIFVPPMYSFNDDTITAMQLESYKIISSSKDISQPGLISKVTSVPATVELSDIFNNKWTMKSLDIVEAEIAASIQKYGFAVIVTHPQEFITDGKLNQANTEMFRTLLITLKKDYSLVTLKHLGEHLPRQ